MATIHDFTLFRVARALHVVSGASSEMAGEVRTFQHYLGRLKNSVRKMEDTMQDTERSLSKVRAEIDHTLEDWQKMRAALDSGDLVRMRRTLKRFEKQG